MLKLRCTLFKISNKNNENCYKVTLSDFSTNKWLRATELKQNSDCKWKTVTNFRLGGTTVLRATAYTILADPNDGTHTRKRAGPTLIFRFKKRSTKRIARAVQLGKSKKRRNKKIERSKTASATHNTEEKTGRDDRETPFSRWVQIRAHKSPRRENHQNEPQRPGVLY